MNYAIKLEEVKVVHRTHIEWTQWSWSPIVGCLHGCRYCYARKFAIRFPKNFPNGFRPTFYPDRLKEPWNLRKPSKIFVCSVSDLFAPWTRVEWRDAVLESIFKCPVKHTFQLLTKNPECIPPIKFPPNVWVGTTVTNENRDWRNISEIIRVDAKVRFVSFEPLLSPLPRILCLRELEWIIVGKLTGSRRVKLERKWVEDIINEARNHNIPIFIKNNVNWPDKIQEFPCEGCPWKEKGK